MSSIEAVRERGLRFRFSRSERNWFLSAGLLFLLLAFFTALYLVEMDLGRWKTSLRLIRNPSESAARYVGISHFTLAFLYTLTSKRMRSVRRWMSLAACLAAGGVLCAGFARLSAASPVLAAVAFYAYFLSHDARDQLAFCRANGDGTRSLRVVYGGTAAVLLLGLVIGGGYAIVILHVACWYVFTTRQLAERPVSPVRGWSWLRSTVPGFRLLHAGSLALFLLAGAVWAYGFGNDPSFRAFSVLLSPENFPYWTILHVTVSFAPK
jgi:hypothetical protein